MSQPNLKAIQLDADTIIYVQVNDAQTPIDLDQPLEPSPDADPEAHTAEPEPILEEPFEEDFEEPDVPRSATLSENSSNDEEDDPEIEVTRTAKGLPWHSSHQTHNTARQPSSRQPSSQPLPSSKPTPAKRVGTLVRAYTQHLVQDIRNTAITDVDIEKVTLEFGVSLDTELNAYIASSALGCSVKVAIECNLSKKEK